MKTLEFLLCIIFILSNVGIKGSNYSIDNLLNYLQETQYYDIIYQVKLIFGDDIAISVCKSFIANYQCEDVVRIYMDPAGRPGQNRPPIRIPKEEDLNLKCKLILSRFYIPPAKRPVVIFILYYNDILKIAMNENEISELIEKIIGKKNIKLIPYKNVKDEIDKKILKE